MGRPRLLAALLVAALLLLAFAALRRGGSPSTSGASAPSSENGDPPGPDPKRDVEVPPKAPASTEAKTPAPKPARLRVSVLSPDRDIGGYVVAAGEGRRGEGHVEIGGRGRAEAVFKALKPGRTRVLFVPTSAHAPASAEIFLAPEQEGVLELVPRAAGALEGLVVDALRRPLAGLRVKAVAEGAFEASAGPVVPLMSIRRMSASGGPGVDLRSFRSFSAYSDGRLELAVETDAAGRFQIAGLPGPTVQVLVGEGAEALKRACAIDAPAYLIVPVVKEPLPEAETPEGLRDSLAELADQLGRDPQADAAYWALMREELRKSIEASGLSARDKTFLRPLVESLGRPK